MATLQKATEAMAKRGRPLRRFLEWAAAKV